MQKSIIKFKNLNPEFRIDAEYYREEILNRLDVISLHNQTKLEQVADFIVGPFGSTVTVDLYIDDSDYRYIRNKDINDFIIKDHEPALIPEDVYNSLPQFHIKKYDLLITVVGTLGKVAIATQKDTKSIFSCKSTIIRSKNINPIYLLTYLNSDTGRLFSLRGKRGAIQEGLNLSDLKEIQVFIPTKEFQELIEKLVINSIDKLNKSNFSYDSSKNMLFGSLDITDWQPRRHLNYIKNYSDTKQAGRIDAEYFQPFYSEIDNKLKSKGLVYIKDICDVINYGTVPTSLYSEDGSGIPYIKGLNLKNLEISTDKLDYINNTQDLPKKVFTKEGDIIISQMGTVGNCGVVNKEQENWIFASFTIRIRLKDKSKYHPNYVALYIETIAKPYYLFRNIAQASVRQNTDLPTIKNMPIPDLKFKDQLLIAEKVKQSCALKKQSKQLLEIAKQGVEIAIEKDENKAQKWIHEQLKINKLSLITIALS